ncbi:acetyl-CoA C-acetyltransferase [Entomohabitans teleogrylli]|uniref:acetyl-CoA C-acetyltransferase n=1 Tax=Entomohabitans teleogrylli TaxID=1384589 RepID=UPI00073D4B2E|nr:acetyl-CoA C-acetyltransferase [Entomohabitans teleogrylli]
MDSVVIVRAQRTAIGKFGGMLSGVPAVKLGALAIGACLETLPEECVFDEVILGNVLQAGSGQNPARQAALLAGISLHTPAFTVNKVCGSAMKAVVLGAQAIQCGDAAAIVAGGMENMSLAPYVLDKARQGYRMGDGVMVDAMLRDGLWCAINHQPMGITAENLATRYAISREEQDAMALASQRKAVAAIREGRFADEIVPVEVTIKKEKRLFAVDEFPREDATMDSLAALRPAFTPAGSVTAGNASGINDAAAALVLMSETEAHIRGITPLARIRGWASSGVAPEIMGIGPVQASRRALAAAGVELADIDLIEANEAFAAQYLAVERKLGLDARRVNVNGGAIALGHPIGASGARILVTLVHALRHYDKQLGLATLCIGGGQGIAMVIERL